MCERCGQSPCKCHLPLSSRPGGKCRCGGTYYFNNYCGAWVCEECDDHKGLGCCFCGWKAGGEHVEPGELEDDVGDSTFDGDSWNVEY